MDHLVNGTPCRWAPYAVMWYIQYTSAFLRTVLLFSLSPSVQMTVLQHSSVIWLMRQSHLHLHPCCNFKMKQIYFHDRWDKHFLSLKIHPPPPPPLPWPFPLHQGHSEDSCNWSRTAPVLHIYYITFRTAHPFATKLSLMSENILISQSCEKIRLLCLRLRSWQKFIHFRTSINAFVAN